MASTIRHTRFGSVLSINHYNIVLNNSGSSFPLLQENENLKSVFAWSVQPLLWSFPCPVTYSHIPNVPHKLNIVSL